MSELAIRDRLMDIYSQQAAMGMGCMNEYLAPMSDPYGNGLMIGGAGKRKRKLSSYNIFVKKFMAANRDKYDSVTDAMSAAAQSWRKCRKTKGKKTKIGKKKVSCSRRRKTYRRKGGYLDDEESDDDYFGDGLIVGGAEKKKKVKRSDLPSAAQLRALGITASDFNTLKQQTRNTSRGFTVPKYSTGQLARIGNRFGTRYVGPDGKQRCRGPSNKGNYFLNSDYECVDYVQPFGGPALSSSQYPEIASMDAAYAKARQNAMKKLTSEMQASQQAVQDEYVDLFTEASEQFLKKKNLRV